MDNSYHKMIDPASGLPLDAVILDTDTKFKEGRVPKVGSKIETQDGRCFRLCSTNSVFVASEMVGQQTALAAEFAGKLTAAAIGATQVILDITGVQIFGATASTVAKDRLAGGYITISDDAGEGYNYPIIGNSIQDANAKTTIDLGQPLKVAVTTDTDCVLGGRKYRNVIEGAAAINPIGACLVPTTGASSTVEAFFWVQTKGPAACLGVATIGVPISQGASGAVQVATAITENLVGCGLATQTDGTALVDLKLE